MTQFVSIKDLDVVAVLATLYNASAPYDEGFDEFRSLDAMSYDEAEKVIDEAYEFFDGSSQPLRFNVVYGRALYVDLSKDTFDARRYDYFSNGVGTAQRAIEDLRRSGNVAGAYIITEHAQSFLYNYTRWMAIKAMQRSNA